MFINAHLRPVLHGFETFVPQRAELLHQRERLVDMTNNGVSAWADFRDAASLASTPESFFDQHNKDFGDNENTSVRGSCSQVIDQSTDLTVYQCLS